MRRHITTLLQFCTLAVLFSGCRKELCYDHDMHSYDYRLEAVIELEAAIDGLQPEEIEGVAVVLYSERDGRMAYSRELHLPAEGGRLTTDADTRAILFYNDDTEYILFNGMASLAEASVTTSTRAREAAEELHPGERTVSPPDMLYACCIGDFQPVRTEGYHLLPVTLRPLVHTYTIRYEIAHGAEYVALARGALAGMAEHACLADGSTGEDGATLLYDCELTAYGAEASVRSFGIPGLTGDYYTRAEADSRHYDLRLEVMLRNGKTLTFDFDITDQMREQPRGGIITIGGITISDEEGTAGGSGFDATVEGWGEQQDIELTL